MLLYPFIVGCVFHFHALHDMKKTFKNVLVPSLLLGCALFVPLAAAHTHSVRNGAVGVADIIQDEEDVPQSGPGLRHLEPVTISISTPNGDHTIRVSEKAAPSFVAMGTRIPNNLQCIPTGDNCVNTYDELMAAVVGVNSGNGDGVIALCRGTATDPILVTGEVIINSNNVEICCQSLVAPCILRKDVLGTGRILQISGASPSLYDLHLIGGTNGNLWIQDTSTVDGVTSIVGCIVEGATSSGYGGGASILSPGEGSRIFVADSTFRNNAANGYGGGLLLNGYLDATQATVSNCLFDDNHSAAGGGGGLAVFGFDDEVHVEGSTFDGNHALWGGGAFFGSIDRLYVQGSTFNGNSAEWQGGAMYLSYYVYGFYAVDNESGEGEEVNTAPVGFCQEVRRESVVPCLDVNGQ
jgi:hypothetical protein